MAHSQYLGSALDPTARNKVISKLCRQIKKLDCDSIAFTGMSGALIAPIVAYKTNKNVILIRKEKDNSHSCFKIEASTTSCSKYVIIDDCIATGSTINRMIEEMEEDGNFTNANCVAILLYSDNYPSKSRIKKGVPIISCGV